MTIAIRRMEDRDLEEVLRLWSLLCQEFESRAEMTSNELRMGSRTWLNVYVAEVEGEIAGFIDFVLPNFHQLPLQDAVYIGELFVKPAFRRQNVAKLLVEKIIRLARENQSRWKASRIVTNAENRVFWEKRGFVPMMVPKSGTKSAWSHEFSLG